MDSEEEIMSENEECVFENSACESFTSLICTGNAQTLSQMYEQPVNHLQYANLVLEDSTSSEKSWTNEKHSLYLNSIEEAFVSRLYQQGYYTYPCKRLQADREAASVFNTDLNEEVESGFYYDYEPFAFTPNAQKHSKKCRLKDICCRSETFQERDKNEKRKKRKLQHDVAEPDMEIRHVLEEVQSVKHNHEHASNFYDGQDRLNKNRSVSENLMKTFGNSQEDQVVPYTHDTCATDDDKPC